MPNDSPVKHSTSNYYLEMRKDYIEMFDGDACAAILMALFEWLNANELKRLRLANEEGDPWIKAKMTKIEAECLGLYSIRSLQERIDRLEECGFLTVNKPAPGEITRYLFNHGTVSEALGKQKRYAKNPSSAILPTGGAVGKTVGKTVGSFADEEPVYNLKEVRNKKEENLVDLHPS